MFNFKMNVWQTSSLSVAHNIIHCSEITEFLYQQFDVNSPSMIDTITLRIVKKECWFLAYSDLDTVRSVWVSFGNSCKQDRKNKQEVP